jgi:iron complex outermembrane receptor protein
MKNNKLRIMVAALGSAGLLTHFGVSAQTTTPPPKAEKIEVTGSNIKRADAESPSIVQVLTKEDIQRSGASSVAELLKSVPAIAGGNLDDYNAGNGFARGTTSASLRGLGSVGTLVLINGRRVAPSATADPNTGQGSAYNLNSIPLAAVERVEILKDGASAIYGSDAIAGVINFILRKDYTGAQITVTAGSSFQNTFRNGTISAAAGIGDLAKDRYNVLLAGEYYTREPEDFNAPNGVQNDAYRRLASRNLVNSSTLSVIPNFFRESVRGNGVFNVGLPTDPRCPAANVVSATAGCRANALDV